ncbi:MAG: hypothetical protein JJ863_11945 [Deltaproteobacteria bacterium]|nr:hypothetical protein [Deltaproteobacteria bacterium]
MVLRRSLVLVVWLVACGDDDAISTVDSGVDDDASAQVDAGSLSCSFPAARLGDSTQAVALAASPARCGQAAHSWLPASGMGTVVETERLQRLGAAVLRGALETGGVTLPRELEYDVIIDRVLYTTQDRGEPIEATAAVAYPDELPEGATPDIVLLLHGTTGFSDACAPSDTLEGRALAALFASVGYVAVAPDYIGIKALGDPSPEVHPYLVGQATAIASLDSVRALAQMDPNRIGACVSPRVLVFGGSQGGHAALWVDWLADYYAPELELVSTVATVPPIDLLAQVERGLQSEVDASANSTAMLAAAGVWYGYESRLGEVFREPYDNDVLEALELSCTEDAPDVPDLVLEDLYQPVILDAASAETFADVDPWGCVVAENGLTTTSIERTRVDPTGYGILLTFGSDDPLVHTPIEREAYRSLCEAGIPVAMIECEGADHGGGTLWAIAEILEFMDERASGEAFVQPSCDPPAPVVCSGTPP